MWMLVLYSFAIIITSILTHPVRERALDKDSRVDPEEVDEFFENIKAAFSKGLKPDLPVRRDYIQEDTADAESLQPAYDENKMQRRDDTSVQNYLKNDRYHDSIIAPLYHCDRYDPISRLCINIRQLGTTLTLGVNVANEDTKNRIRWFRCFKLRDSDAVKQEEFTRDRSPWNINIGGKNNELRISPITETDFSYNYFKAVLEIRQILRKSRRRSATRAEIHSVKFHIKPINIDMGVLYHGEELLISARAFMELPISSVQLEWSVSSAGAAMPDFDRYLPSNMKVKADGSSVSIKELRAVEDKILTCAVYSNKNVFLARRNFLLRKIAQPHPSSFGISNKRIGYRRRKKRSYEEIDDLEDLENQRNQEWQPLHREDDLIPSDLYDNSPEDSPPYQSPEYNPNYWPVKFDKPSELPPIQRELFYENMFSTRPLQKNFPFYGGKTWSKIYDMPQHKRNIRLDEGSMSQSQIMPPLSGLIEQANSLVETPEASNERPYATLEDSDDGNNFDDAESKLLADCKVDSDCSIHATCIRGRDGENFCRCIHGFKGNGIFCWNV